MYEGPGCVLSAELKAIYSGLKVAKNMGLKKVNLESDSMNALTLMKNGCSFYHDQYQLVMKITELLTEDWKVIFSNIYREQNAVADGLAKKALKTNWKNTEIRTVPAESYQHFVTDMKGANSPM